MADAKKCDLCGKFYSLKNAIENVPANNIMYLQKESIRECGYGIKIEMCDDCAMIIDNIMNTIAQNNQRV